ncbi:MAG: hypothetical protein V1822_01300, partial [Candidatus Micrarchaeota archaeon]
MPKIIAMDESGKTGEIVAVCLVSIPKKELACIDKILSVPNKEREEIRILYHRVCGGEFKYANIRHAFRRTKFPIYDKFLRQKLEDISKLNIQIYFSVFPNASDNAARLVRIKEEADFLVHTWAHQNREDALDKGLEFNVDQQIFKTAHMFQYYCRRNKSHAMLIEKRKIIMA